MSEEKGYKKVEDVIFKFENEGDTLKGVLLSKEKNSNSDYDNFVCKIKEEDTDEIITFFTTKVLETKLKTIDVGTKVKIVMTGSKPSKSGRNDTKLFDVFYKE